LKADKLFINGSIITMDPDSPVAEAVAVAKDKVIGIGNAAQMISYQDQTTEVIDLQGYTLMPGFNDSHLHMLMFGNALLNVPLQGLTSIEEMVGRIRERAAVTPVGEWILGAGWDQNLFREERYPTRFDLDQVTPDHPVALRHVSGHAVLINTAAMVKAGITGSSIIPAGGHMDLDEAGEPTGVLRETASELISYFYYPSQRDTSKKALKLAMERALQSGVTSVSDNSATGVVGGFPVYFELLQELWEEDAPIIRTAQYISDSEIDRVIHAGIRSGDGDEKVMVGGIKIFCDGSFMAQTAAVRTPFLDNPTSHGLFMHSKDELNILVEKAHNNGLQVAIHAIGDAGIDAALDAIERALMLNPKNDHRHRIVHFEILTEDILERTRKLGIVCDIQPKFVSSQGGWVEKRVGPERAKLVFPWKTVLERGIPCGGSSDCPVEPIDPLFGIHAACNRQVDNIPGMTFQPQEALTVQRALQLFTRDSAYTTFEEGRKGMIKSGFLADFVVLSENPLTIDQTKIRDLDVIMTVVGGKIYDYREKLSIKR
jgi:hypothetical protein